MSMDGEHQVFHRSFKFHCSNGFRDELSGLRSDDVNAQNLSMLRIGNNFYETVVLSHNRSARVGSERELANLQFITGLAGLGFGETDAADFGMAVGGIRNPVGVDRLYRLASDLSDRHDAFHHGYMRQLRRAQDDVADGVNARLLRL